MAKFRDFYGFFARFSVFQQGRGALARETTARIAKKYRFPRKIAGFLSTYKPAVGGVERNTGFFYTHKKGVLR